MEIGALTQNTSLGLPSVPNKGSDFPAQKSNVDNVPVKIPAVEKVDIKAAEEKRMGAIKEAIQRSKDLFAISDTSFTIFKDAKGQFITRFTSLRDGSVTYFPEPQLVKRLEEAGFDTSTITVNA